MAFDFSTLITDRTLSDVTNKTPKGFYNASDLNRVGACIQELSQELQKYGYKVSVSARTDWAARDAPTVSDLDTYLADVADLRAALPMPEWVPETPQSGRFLTWQRANEIESILYAIETVILRVVRSFLQSNAFTMWAGSPVHLPSATSDLGRNWRELDAMGTTWRNWQVADWYLLLYGNLKAEGDVA